MGAQRRWVIDSKNPAQIRVRLQRIRRRLESFILQPATILNGNDLADRVKATTIPNLWIVPSELDLAAAELELSSEVNYLGKLRSSLKNLSSNFGLKAILIDCPPTLGLLTMNSLCAADNLLVT